MKKIISLVIVVLSFYNSYTQGLTPIPFSKEGLFKTKLQSYYQESFKNYAYVDSPGYKYLNYGLDNTLKKKMDTLVDSLNNLPVCYFNVQGGINNVETFTRLSGNASLLGVFRISKFKFRDKSYKILDPNYIYIGFNTRTAFSDDTALLVKTFLFPELNKRDFIIGFFTNSLNNATGWETSFLAEFSLNKHFIDKRSSMFNSTSIKFGMEKKKTFTNQNNIWISFSPYVNIIHVDEKNEQTYNALFKETNLPSTYVANGIIITLGSPTTNLFCDIKYVGNMNAGISNNDLKGMVYTIGIKSALNLTFIRL